MKQNQIGNITELVAEEGQYITQNFEAWNERLFLKRITVSPDDISKWRDATKKEKTDYEYSTPLKPKRTALTPLFEARGAKFNDETGYYELNGITNIGEEEMTNIYNLTAFPAEVLNYSPGYINMGRKCRTNLPGIFFQADVLNDVSFYICPDFEVITIRPFNAFNYSRTLTPNIKPECFYYCVNLKNVTGTFDISGKSEVNNYTYELNKLEEVFFYGCKVNFVIFGKAPKINLPSLRYLVENAQNTNPISVWVHANTYARLTGTSTEEDYQITGNTKEEWMQLVTDAAIKNITFIIPEQ